jgi:cytochrome c2
VKRYVGLVLLLAACHKQESPSVVSGNPTHGKDLITQYGCTACHIVPGIEGANGMVGPSLEHVASRQIIAGHVTNTAPAMIAYLQNPQSADPQNVMPNLGLKPEEARDITAYLYTLK